MSNKAHIRKVAAKTARHYRKTAMRVRSDSLDMANKVRCLRNRLTRELIREILNWDRS